VAIDLTRRVITASPKRILAAGRRVIGAQPEPVPESPLGQIEVTGNIETDDAAEIAVVSSYIAEARKAQAAVKEAMSTQYSVTLVFPSTIQANEFLAKAGWNEFTDSSGAFFDGLAVAEKLGIETTAITIPFRKQVTDRRIAEEVGIEGAERLK
jgi:hypothetical protein